MSKLKTVKFSIAYLFTLFIGNLIVYEVDKISVKYGQEPMSIFKYIFVNFIVLTLSILTYLAIRKQEKK